MEKVRHVSNEFLAAENAYWEGKTKRALSSDEQHHLTTVNIKSMAAFLETRKGQAHLKTKYGKEPCPVCRGIAKKLGIE